jgi:mannose-6-phosphate isomerase-like protein (cupin superfamily)
MKVIDPQKNPITPTPDHTGVTSQEIAGAILGAKSCDVKLGFYEPGGKSILHSHPHSEHVLYILEGQLTVFDEAKNKATARKGEALYVPAGEVHMVENRGKVQTRYIAVTAPPPA